MENLKATPGSFTTQIVGTQQLSDTASQPPFMTTIKVINSSGTDKWARVDFRVTIGDGTIFNDSKIFSNVPNGPAGVSWIVYWSGRWSSTHVILANLWVSGDTSSQANQSPVQAGSATASVMIGSQSILPVIKDKPSTNTSGLGD